MFLVKPNYGVNIPETLERGLGGRYMLIPPGKGNACVYAHGKDRLIVKEDGAVYYDPESPKALFHSDVSRYMNRLVFEGWVSLQEGD